MKAKKILSELFYPSEIKCLVCGDEIAVPNKYLLCAECSLNKNTQFCLLCGRAIENMALYCNDCMNANRSFDQARSAFVYEGDVPALIHRLKYGSARYLAEKLARFMADAYYEADWDIDCIVYVPMHRKRYKRRGYNQARLLADALGELVGRPVTDALERTIYTKNLARMSKERRQQAIAGSISLKNADLAGKNVLLIDDVLTTAATAEECARVLKRARCGAVYVLTAASARKKPDLY